MFSEKFHRTPLEFACKMVFCSLKIVTVNERSILLWNDMDVVLVLLYSFFSSFKGTVILRVECAPTAILNLRINLIG